MMLFAAAMAPATPRSSLEVMLDSIRKRGEQPKDLPPALPCRPTSRGRLPTSRRYLQANFAVKSNSQEINDGMPERREEVKQSGQISGIIGGTRQVEFKWSEQSPDPRIPGLESYEETPEAESIEENQCGSSLAVNLHGHFNRGEVIIYSSKKKLPVWCWLPEQKWQLGKIQSVLANDVLVMMFRGKILSSCLENILPTNPEIHDAVNDIAQLTYINEPSVLHTLKYGYSQDMIYDQLLKLIKQLENTNPHFIGCIKPNNKQLPGIYEEELVMQQLRCFSFHEIIRISTSCYLTTMTHEQFAEMYQFLLVENEPSQDPLSASVAVLHQHNVLPDMHQVGYTKIFLRAGQVAVLETARVRTLQAILSIQKYFRGVRARCTFKEIKKGVTTLQSFIRAVAARREFQNLVLRHRAVVHIQKHVKQRIAEKRYVKQRKYIMLLQSVIRGWLTRKKISPKRILEMEKCKRCNYVNLQSDQNMSLHELKDIPQERPLVQPSDMAELYKRFLKAEAELRHKEEENSSLRQQLQQYQVKWSDYDAKMKSMEEMWQKQMTSLQMSLAAAKKSLATNGVVSLAIRLDSSPNHPYFDSEDTMSVETYRAEGTPTTRSHTSVAGLNRTPDGARNAVSELVKEFQHQKHIFEDDAGFLVEVKSGQSISNVDPYVELRKLKVQFAAWKKDYKVRLQETKTKLNKFGNSETAKRLRKWWGKRKK